MPMYTKSGRSLWPVVVGALVVVVLGLVVALVVVATRDDTPGTTAEPTPTATPSHTHEGVPGGTPELGDPPTGCLAGPGRDADMVLATQAEAPHTAYGAVEMAASYLRWSVQYPFPAASAVERVQDAVMAADAPQSFRDLAGGYAKIEANPAQAGAFAPGSAPFGTPFYLSTRTGKWVVDPSSSDDRVIVKLSAGYVVDDALSKDDGPVTTIVLVWEGEAWRVEKMQNPDPEALAAGGTAYTAGC